MKVVVAGLGSIGTRHAGNYKKLGVDKLVGCDPDKNKRNMFESETGDECVASLEEALKSRPDLVVIASPNRYHLDQALLAAKSGCHLFIEKPVSHTLNMLDDLIRLIEEQSLFAHVGSNWKFHPAFKEMKKIIDQDALGKITGAQVIAGQWLPDWHPWEDYRQMYSAKKEQAGGIVLDSHEFDYLSWLLGPVKDVTGYISHSGALEIETEDVAVACMQLESGALATVHVDYIQRDYRRRYHISGDAGTLEWDYKTGEITLYDAAKDDTKVINVAVDDLNAMYLEQSQHVLAGIKGEVSPVTSVAAAKEVLKILLAIKEPNRQIN